MDSVFKRITSIAKQHKRSASAASTQSSCSYDLSSVPEADSTIYPNGSVPQLGLDDDLAEPRECGFDLGESRQSAGLERLRRRTGLTANLADLLKDATALTAFIHFMDSVGASHLVQFWIIAESFEASTSYSRTKTCDCISAPKRSLNATTRTSTRRHDELPEQSQSSGTEVIEHNPTGREFCCDSAANDRLPSVSSLTSTVSFSIESNKPCDSSICSSDTNCNEERHHSHTLHEMTQQDGFNIYNKFLCEDSEYYIGVTRTIQSEVYGSLIDATESVNSKAFAPAQKFVFAVMENRYLPQYVKSIFYYKHQWNVLTCGSVTLCDVLHCDMLRDCFLEFLDRAGVYIEFLLAADSFRQEHSAAGVEQAREDATVLYKRYFSLDSPKFLNFGSDIRQQVVENICRAKETSAPDRTTSCFDRPMRIAWHLLEKDYLPCFLQSDQFRKYLSELNYTIQNYLELPPPSGQRRIASYTTGSDASATSGDSNSVQSCPETRARRLSLKQFLAKNQRHQKVGRSSKKNIPLDSNVQLSSAKLATSALWERPSHQQGLSLGRMDEFGQYVRDFDDTFAGAASKNSPFSAIKKLVKTESAVSDDIASRVAQLIVQDIRNQTLNNEDG